MKMDKAKFVLFVVGAVILAYLIMTPLIPFISDVSSNAASNVTASNYSASYVGAVEAAQYAPLWIYFIPGVLGVGAIAWKLKKD